jgi:hypothetical protein
MDGQQEPPKIAGETIAYIIAGIIVVLLLIAWGIYAKMHKNHSTQTTNQTPAGQQQNLNNTATLTPTTTPASIVKPPAKKLSYGDAIKAYPERFQFVQCRGTPASISVKKGTPVMLDNRDRTAHTFKADTQTFKIAGYDYAVAYPSVIGSLYVTCDGINRVMLNVEK